ncbi:hypothetical protein L0U88_15415 [Flavihumibacter sp. RY-1]|uniref:Heavy-metal resistance protein n=1 Tax=Flavihumibacter fluminis TaxID=2909236 RepID=A0ABS9BLM1_9BACT|nr:hypothetical protein [Flavihumibacter fluminis]MCF1716028.1 hypothetical protein [Flavihumibacter fluminis]
MQNKTLIIVIAALLISNLVLLGAYFWGREKKTPQTNRNDRSPVEYMTREIGFDSTQKQQFRELWETVSNNNRGLYDSIRQNREALYANLKLEPQPETLIDSLAGKIAGFEKQISMNNYRHFRKVRAICSNEQQVKLDTVINRLAKKTRRR